MAKMKIRQGDRVRVISGKDKGKEGVVLKAMPREGRVVVEKVAVVKKAVRPTTANPKGGIVEREASIDVSNVMLIDPKTGEPTRVGIKRKDGKAIRVSKKTGEEI